MRQRLEQYDKDREKDLKEIAALNAALSAHIGRPPSPPATPLSLPPDYIFQLLEEPLIDSVRARVQPLVDELRNNLQDAMREQNELFYSTVWEKMSLTLKVIEAFSARLQPDGSLLQQ